MARTEKPFRLWLRDGVFYVKYPGKGWHSTGEKKRTAAESWAVAHATAPARPQGDMSGKTLRQFLEPYFTPDCPHCADRLRFGGSLTERYRRNMRRALELHVFTDELVSLKVGEIRRFHYDAFLGRLQAKHSPRMVNLICQALRIAVRHGVFLQQLPQDFTAGFRRFKELTRKTGIFSQAEIGQMFRESPGPWKSAEGRLAFLLMYVTGARRAEIAGIRWRALDLDGQVATIDEQLQDDGLRAPKWGHVRTVPLPRTVADELRDWKDKQFRHALEDFVFCNLDGSPHKRKWITLQFKAMIKALAIDAEGRNLKIHSFRASGHSHLIAAGFDQALARSSFGWTSEDVQRRYLTLRPDDLRQQAELLEGILKQ